MTNKSVRDTKSSWAENQLRQQHRIIKSNIDEDFKKAMTINPALDPFDTSFLGKSSGIPNYVVQPKTLENNISKYSNKYSANWTDKELENLTLDETMLATPEQIKAANKALEQVKELDKRKDKSQYFVGAGLATGYDKNDEHWVQTFSGRRFNILNPNPDAIVIQDIAHHLSMQCRFAGGCQRFYSTAQHSVLVSYICDKADRLWGLLHDGEEYLCSDLQRPFKHSPKLAGYRDVAKKMQEAVCIRFGLPLEEPASVKQADMQLLTTEARDLMSPLHSDWQNKIEPLPFKIDTWDQQTAKDMFMKRFFELTNAGKESYEHYYKQRTVRF